VKFWAAFGVAVVVMGAAAQAVAAERKTLVIASGEVTGYYFPVAGALCRVINKDKPNGWSCAVMPTSGSAANVAALRSGEADLAILQSRAADMALHGREGFKDLASPDLRALMSLHSEVTLAMARPGSAVEKASDLRGKRVNLGRPGSFQRVMAVAALDSVGISEGDLGVAAELDLADEARELCEGNIDVAFFSGVHPMTEVANVLEQCAAVPVPVVPRASMAKATPWLSATVIKGDTYDGVRADVPAVGVRAVLVATGKLPAEDSYAVMKAIHANFAALGRLHPALKGLSKAETTHDGIAIPLHDGAQKLYGEGK
jgi:uncharacterized protein